MYKTELSFLILISEIVESGPAPDAISMFNIMKHNPNIISRLQIAVGVLIGKLLFSYKITTLDGNDLRSADFVFFLLYVLLPN